MKLTTIAKAVSIALALSAPITFADTTTSIDHQNNAAASQTQANSQVQNTQASENNHNVLAATEQQNQNQNSTPSDQKIGPDQNQTTNPQQTQPGAIQPNSNQSVTAPSATETGTTKPGVATDLNQRPQPQQVKPTSSEQQPQQHFAGQEQVLSFAEQAAIATFSYDYKNYQAELKKMEAYFTESGWQSFDKAIKESKNLDVIQKEKLNVTAKLNGQARVVKRDQLSTGAQWIVEIPIQVTYQNENNQQFNQELLINMTLVHNSKVASGLGIMQFIAKPAQKQEQTPA